MKGRNQIEFNQASMQEILQEYIDDNMPGFGTVTSAKATQDGSCSQVFTVHTEVTGEIK